MQVLNHQEINEVSGGLFDSAVTIALATTAAGATIGGLCAAIPFTALSIVMGAGADANGGVSNVAQLALGFFMQGAIPAAVPSFVIGVILGLGSTVPR